MRTLLIGALAAVALGGTLHRFETATAAHALHATSTGRDAQSAAGPADPDVVAVVDRVFASSEHPGLKWSAIPDTVPTLKPLYDAEGDRLMWFERNAPVPGVERALAAIGRRRRPWARPGGLRRRVAGRAVGVDQGRFRLCSRTRAVRPRHERGHRTPHPLGAHGPRRSADDAVGLYGGAEEDRRDGGGEGGARGQGPRPPRWTKCSRRFRTTRGRARRWPCTS